MEAYAERLPNLKLRRIELSSWSCALAQHHQIRRLPTLYLYDNGKLVSQDLRTIFQRLMSL